MLPKGFRRARNFGFLHPNCKRLIALLQVLLKFASDPGGGLVQGTPAHPVPLLRSADGDRHNADPNAGAACVLGADAHTQGDSTGPRGYGHVTAPLAQPR